jgi:hypothetical protein
MEFMKRVAVVMAMMIVLGLGAGVICPAWAQKDEDEGPMSNMHFVVVRDYNGKPVKNAAVVLHPVKKNGKQAMGGLELKTGEDGRAGIDGIPYGPLRVQVLAPGFQTFGEDYDVNKPETLITVKLKRPGAQYSIYEAHEKDKKAGDKKAVDQKTPDQKPQ